MTKPRQTLLDDLERDTLNEDVPLATALRKCIALGGRVGSAELREWAERELRGYQGAEELPAYRIIPAPLEIDGINGNWRYTGQQISPSVLPDPVSEVYKEEIELRFGIGEIEAMIAGATKGKGVKLQPPGAADAVRLINHSNGDQFQQVMSLYWVASISALRGVVDQVRTRLVGLVAEIRAGLPSDDALPSSELAAQAVNVVLNGSKRARVSVIAAQSNDKSENKVEQPGDQASRSWRLWGRLGAAMVGIATIVAAIIAYLAWR